MMAAHHAASAFFERLAKADPRAAQRRSQAEQNACKHGDSGGESKHPAVDGDGRETWNVARVEPAQESKAPDREEQPERAAYNRQQHAFGQQLPHHTPAS